MSDKEEIERQAFIRGSSPAKVLSLLETLEKTRALAHKLVNIPVMCECGEDERRLMGVGIWPHTPECPTAIQDEVRALLSGFSGDASKEEK